MEFTIGSRYEVKVIEVKDNLGAVVELEDGSTSLIHISNISDKFVKHVSDFVQIGDMLVAKCIQGKARPAELSLKDLKLNNKSDSHGHNYHIHIGATGGYGGLANPSLGFSSGVVARVVIPGQGDGMSFAAKAAALEGMIESSNRELDEKLKSSSASKRANAMKRHRGGKQKRR